ncbi:hypothetical protein R8G64_06405 [Tenacibaculum maritimum]|uniref:hypothetical protein n=1 Tax=Tenacibaculum maritimum TaxID=107401 RepID=UPI0013301B43|nr:hypothetical protein [Tenacibaculum maritimum]
MRKISIHTLFITMISCSNKIKFYHGYIYDTENKPLKNIKVEENDNLKMFSYTNEKGYFKITEKNTFGGNLIVSKKNIILDTIYAVYSSHGEKLNYRFTNGRNDTLFLSKEKITLPNKDCKLPVACFTLISVLFFSIYNGFPIPFS